MMEAFLTATLIAGVPVGIFLLYAIFSLIVYSAGGETWLTRWLEDHWL